MSAKYSRVPSVDPELGHDISLDFGSDFTYNNPGQSSKKYQSIFSYGDSRHQMDQSISVGMYDHRHLMHGQCFLLTVLMFRAIR